MPLKGDQPQGFPPALAARYWREFGPARRVLDVGCGTGSLGAHRPSGHAVVHGVDREERLLALAAEHEDEVSAVDLDAGRLPFADESFDAALVKDVLEHVADPLRVAREVHRVLVPGGILVASVVVSHPRRVWDDYSHMRGFTRTSAERLFTDAGFKVKSVWRMGPVPGAARLGILDLVPSLLRVPGIGRLWTASWEVLAERAGLRPDRERQPSAPT